MSNHRHEETPCGCFCFLHKKPTKAIPRSKSEKIAPSNPHNPHFLRTKFHTDEIKVFLKISVMQKEHRLHTNAMGKNEYL